MQADGLTVAVICVCAAWSLVLTVTWLQSSITRMYHSFVDDSHLLPHKLNPSTAIYVRGGGAIRVIVGSLLVTNSHFSRCSAGPLDGDFDSCALSFSASTRLCTDGLGGAISGDRADMTGETLPLEAKQADIAPRSSGNCAAGCVGSPLTALWVSVSTFCMPTQWMDPSSTRERQSDTIASSAAAALVAAPLSLSAVRLCLSQCTERLTHFMSRPFEPCVHGFPRRCSGGASVP